MNPARIAALRFARPRFQCLRRFSDMSSDNVGPTDSVPTWSGGQEGIQGGFYGSGGARAKAGGNLHHRPEAVAAPEDIERLKAIMKDVEEFETELSRATTLNAKTIEIKSLLKKTISSPAMTELLNRLEINSEPVWGLTLEEREMVRLARKKVNMR